MFGTRGVTLFVLAVRFLLRFLIDQHILHVGSELAAKDEQTSSDPGPQDQFHERGNSLIIISPQLD